MSIIIDILKKKSGVVSNEDIPKQGVYDSKTQELLAETYLRSSETTKAEDTTKTERPEPKKKTKNLIIPTALFMLAVLLCAALIYVFTSRALSVNISIIRKPISPYENLLATQAVELIGGATTDESGYISLINNDAKTPAGAAINLKRNLDLSRKSLLIGALPKGGGGRLRVILRDKNHRSYISDTLHIRGFKKGRQNFIITADKPKESIDIKKVQQIRVEFEKSSKQDEIDSAILLEKVLLISD